ncbi:hypothetical protein BU23DRAFT_185761 [Bimuria novae-zelandiae CBS 107.79]|uniref:TAFII28-like protein domain-containing protein n=1 Tax=Bimuria novae-zelandiae CBS 107.79 TaxID=1447943 RepID=A0A6A5V3U6_9PLEO|nr:hypothetical protein BU23DRAFT_185761 [Bimuria novae-zelandiae CBS 107.79]
MTSPPHIPQINVPNPRKRGSISSVSSQVKKRKPSNLRNSFDPDNETSVGSPLRHSRSPSVGSIDTASFANGGGGKKRKRKNDDGASIAGSSVRGAQPDNGSLNGAAGAEGEEDDEADDDYGEEREEGVEGERPSAAAREQAAHNERLLVMAMDPSQQDAYAVYRRVQLKTAMVRKLVNQTLSQSVPPNVILAVKSYSKAFVGELIDRALTVRDEWAAARTHMPNPDMPPNILQQGLQEPFGHRPTSKPNRQQLQNAHLHPHDTVANMDFWKEIPRDVSLQDRLKEEDKGPLTPAHLREALRRYKRDRDGGGAGFAGLSLEGPERTLARTGGRRLFR